MDIRVYVLEKYTLHPFLIECFDHERMWQYYALKTLEQDKFISSLEAAVKRDYPSYKFLASYFDGPREQFKFKEEDKALIKEIALDMKARSNDEFSRLNKPVPPPRASGHKFLDMLNLHVQTGQELDDETTEKCVLMYLKGGMLFYTFLSLFYMTVYLPTL